MGYNELKKMIKILLVDDDKEYLQITSLYLRTKGYNIITCTSGQEAIDIVNQDNIGIILIDYYMPGMTGEEAINEIRKVNKECVIILQTGYSGQQPPLETLERLKIQNYYDKTEGAEKLNLQVISAIRVYAQQMRIVLEQYRKKTLIELIVGIAQELQEPIMSLSAGVEAIKVVAAKGLSVEEQEKLHKISKNNLEAVGKIEKVLNALISQSSDKKEEVEALKVIDIVTRIECILNKELRDNKLTLDIDNKTKKEALIVGNITDTVFMLIEIIRNIVEKNKSDEGDSIKLQFEEDEIYWKVYIKAKNLEVDGKVVYMLMQLGFKESDIEFIYNPDEDTVGVVLEKK